MQTQISMNIKQKIICFRKVFGLILTMLFAYANADAQCAITTSGIPCVGEPIFFNCGAPGSSNYNWNFNSEGSNTTACGPSFTFNSPGLKTITVTLKTSSGQNCTATIKLNVKPKPIVKVQRIVNKTQCFANNSFCFTDSSTNGTP